MLDRTERRDAFHGEVVIAVVERIDMTVAKG